MPQFAIKLSRAQKLGDASLSNRIRVGCTHGELEGILLCPVSSSNLRIQCWCLYSLLEKYTVPKIIDQAQLLEIYHKNTTRFVQLKVSSESAWREREGVEWSGIREIQSGALFEVWPQGAAAVEEREEGGKRERETGWRLPELA